MYVNHIEKVGFYSIHFVPEIHILSHSLQIYLIMLYKLQILFSSRGYVQ
jgi:hypothetical protein